MIEVTQTGDIVSWTCPHCLTELHQHTRDLLTSVVNPGWRYVFHCDTMLVLKVETSHDARQGVG